MHTVDISKKLQQIRDQIHLAEKQYNRSFGSVQLLAVSKQQSIEKIRIAIAAGQTCFGENYVQEALPKIAAFKHESLYPASSKAMGIQWHFIGKLQSNKTKQVAENFDWVHSVDSWKIAQRLDTQRPKHLPPLNVCIEVNLSGEENKSGISLYPSSLKFWGRCRLHSPSSHRTDYAAVSHGADAYPAPSNLMGIDALLELAHLISQLKYLRLRGLMTIPAMSHDFKTQCDVYAQIQHAQQLLRAQGFDLDTLSMGMSNDFVAAIAAGSTMVRIGTAIFGEREGMAFRM